MKIKIETDGSIEGTRLINLRTGLLVKNLEVVKIERKNGSKCICGNSKVYSTAGPCDKCWHTYECSCIGCDDAYDFGNVMHSISEN